MGFWELVLISVVALLVLGPEKLPGAIRGLGKFMRSARQMTQSIKAEINEELRIHELHENLKKAEQQGMENLSPDIQRSVDELKQAAQDVTSPHADTSPQSKKTTDNTNKNQTSNE